MLKFWAAMRLKTALRYHGDACWAAEGIYLGGASAGPTAPAGLPLTDRGPPDLRQARQIALSHGYLKWWRGGHPIAANPGEAPPHRWMELAGALVRWCSTSARVSAAGKGDLMMHHGVKDCAGERCMR